MTDGDEARAASPRGARPPTAAEETTGASLIAGGAWKSISSLLPQAYALVISVVAARYLGPDGMGAQSYISFVTISLTTLLASGLPRAITRAIGDARGRGDDGVARGLVRWAWRTQVIAGVVGGALVGTYGLTRTDLQAVWAIAGVVAMASVAHAAPYAALTAMQAWKASAILGMATSTLATIATVVVLALGGGIAGMFAVELVAAVASLVWTAVLSRRLLPAADPRPVPRELRGDVRRFTGFLTISVVLNLIVWRRSEFFFLDRYSTDAAIAMYSIPFAMTGALLRIPEAAASVWFPAVATLLGAGQHERVRTGCGRIIRLMTTIAVPIGAATFVLGPAVLELAYGREYGDAGDVLMIMAIGIPFVPAINMASTLLTGMGRVKAQLLAGVGAAAVNIAIDVLLIPHLHAQGAAIANLAGQLTIGVPLLVLARRAIGPFDIAHRELFNLVAVTALAAAAAAAATRLASGAVADLAVGLVASGVVFVAGATQLRLIQTADLEWLETSAGRTVGRAVRVARRFIA